LNGYAHRTLRRCILREGFVDGDVGFGRGSAERCRYHITGKDYRARRATWRLRLRRYIVRELYPLILADLRDARTMS